MSNTKYLLRFSFFYSKVSDRSLTKHKCAKILLKDLFDGVPERPTLEFGSGHALRVVGSSPRSAPHFMGSLLGILSLLPPPLPFPPSLSNKFI